MKTKKDFTVKFWIVMILKNIPTNHRLKWHAYSFIQHTLQLNPYRLNNIRFFCPKIWISISHLGEGAILRTVRQEIEREWCSATVNGYLCLSYRTCYKDGLRIPDRTEAIMSVRAKDQNSERIGKFPSIFQEKFKQLEDISTIRKYRNKEIMILNHSNAIIKARSSRVISSKMVWELLGNEKPVQKQ